jgi:hypothetical protein
MSLAFSLESDSAVIPVSQYEAARKLVAKHGVRHCRVIMWDKNPAPAYTPSGTFPD